jgi:transposase
MLARSRVHGLWHVRSTEHLWEHPVRRSGGRDATLRLEWDVQVTVRRDEEAVAAAVRQWGGRVSATTHPAAQLSLQEAVLAYRHADLVARAMGRRQGRPGSLTPMSLEREDHATGLIRLWSLGVRVLTRLACGVRRRLATANTPLAGVSVGHPTRATAHPTADRLLEAFQGLTLTVIREGRRRRRHRTPRARVPQRMRALLDFPVALSTRRCPDSHKPP